MGVHHLWSILESSKTEENIESLRDKILCIDLSLWICEAQGTKGLKDQLKPYLRNVFFRILHLTSLGVRPVFVVDGVPPEIKRDTIVKRLQARGEHVRSNAQKKKKLNRSKFTMQCNECCEMMGLLGIPFVKSDGEAEAMCAWLNENDYADGVLTDDSDVFLYGAKVVYKDFNISSSKHQTDNLQVFRSQEIENGLSLTRRNMIALALLLGCDYLPAGVPGVGKETTVKLFTSLPGVDLLDRFHEWKLSPDLHPHDMTSLEMTIKRKAAKLPNFPNKAVMNEFLSPKVGNASVSFHWKCPDLEGIKDFFVRKLDWPKEYTEEKMLILVTDWQLAHIDVTRAPLFCPARITKPRVKKGKEYFEIEWNREEQTSQTWPKTFVTIKPKEIICEKFPALVKTFETELAAKRAKGKVKKTKKDKTTSNDAEGLDDLLSKINKIDLNDETTEHNSDHDFNDKIISEEANENEEYAGKIQFEQNEDFLPYDIEYNSLPSEVAKNLERLENVFHADGKLEKTDSKETDNHTNFVCMNSSELVACDEIQGQALGTLNCRENNNRVVDSSYTLPNPGVLVCGVVEPLNSLHNLADITVDQSFGSDLEAVDNLLTDSFVASLQNLTPVHNKSSCSTKTSPNFELCGEKTSDGSRDSILSELNSASYRYITSSPLNLKRTEVKKQESSTVISGLCNKNDSCNGTQAMYLNIDTEMPSSQETSSLRSRLLKRYQTENHNSIVDNLRSISNEDEVVYREKERKKYTEFSETKRFDNMNEPHKNICNIKKEAKYSSSQVKRNEIIVLD